MQLDMKDMRYTTAGSQIYVEQHALHNFSKILEFFFGEHGNLITFFFFFFLQSAFMKLEEDGLFLMSSCASAINKIIF